MKAARQAHPGDDLIVRIASQTGKLSTCIIRKTPDKIKLGQQVYLRYRIIKPEGYEREEILHPLGRGTAGLLGTVFYTLAQGGMRRLRRLPRSGH